MHSNRLSVALLLLSISSAHAGKIFDMDAIRDPSTLEIEVLENWHRVEGHITTRQKLDPDASRIDFFSTHRKTIRYGGKPYASYLSCPYTRSIW